MPVTALHALSMTTPDNPAYENRPSHWNQTHQITANMVGSEISGAFQNLNGISFGLNGANVTGSYTVPSVAGLISAVNVSGGTTSNNLTALTFADAGGVSFGLNGSVITAAAPAGGGGITNIRVSAGTTSNLLSQITFNNANGISFGLDASTITASHNALTSQSNQALSAANGSFAFQTAQFSNANGVSFVTSAGNAIAASVETSYAASNHSHGNPQLNLTNLSGTTASNSAGFTLSLSAAAGGGGADGGNTIVAGTRTAGSNSAVLFDNANGITFGLNANGGTIVTASHNGLTSQSNQALSAANGSFAFQTAQFSNANGVSFVTSAGSAIAASVETSYAASNHSHGNPQLNLTNISGTTASNSAGFTLSLSAAAPGGGGAINVSAGTTSGNLQTLQFNNANGVTFGLNGSTVTASVSQMTCEEHVLIPFGGMGGPIPFAQSSLSHINGSVYVFPCRFEDHITMDHVKMPVTVTNSSSAAQSGQRGYTINFGVFTNAPGNTTQLTRHYSTTYTIAAWYSSNASMSLSMITAIGNSTSYNDTTSSSAGLNISSQLHGAREFILPMSSVFTPGQYWFAMAVVSSGAGTTGAVLSFQNLGVNHATFNRVGVGTATTNRGFYQSAGMGVWSATSSSIPGAIAITDLRNVAAMPIFFAGVGTV